MKQTKWLTTAAALATLTSLGAVQTHVGLFKLDFGTLQNSVELTDWDTFSDWLFTDFPDSIATWNLTDFSADKKTNVTLTIMDNARGSAPAVGMGSNNLDPQGYDVVYDGINVPAGVNDDYFYRDPNNGGTEMLFRFANLAPGQYHVTVFLGRGTDPDGQSGKIWIDDINGKREPARQNTGNFSASKPWGHSQTVVVNVNAGDYLWYAHMEDGTGGIGGMIIRSWVDSDGDGMPDDWEIKYGLNPHDPSDATTDLNGNGLNNLLEYQSGLDPTDTTRPTILSVVANSEVNRVEVTFSKPLFTGSGIANDPRDATISRNLTNYSISPALAITGLSVKNQVVTLLTAPPPPGITAYTLTVNNLRDTSNWPVAPNTTATFSMGAPVASPQALIYKWFTISGKAGAAGSADGTNSAARFKLPNPIGVDSAGNLYVGDTDGNTIRKIMREGTNWVSSTIAGKAGSSGSADGTNNAARFKGPSGVRVDNSGDVFVTDGGNNTVRKLTQEGTNWVVSTIAGTSGIVGSADGTNSDARFSFPTDIAVDPASGLFVADYHNNNLRKLTPAGTNWVVSTIAGLAGHVGTVDGTNSTIRFHGIDQLAVDPAGDVYLVEFDGHTIRKLTPEGTNWVSSTIAGKAGVTGSADGINSAARFYNPNSIAVDPAGNLFVADFGNHTIRKLMPAGTNWVVSTIGGLAGYVGSANGTNSVARFNGPSCVTLDSAGNVYVTDMNNYTIRMGVPLPVFQSVTPANGSIELIVNAAPGQTVQLQYSSDLDSGTWTNLGNPITAADGMISAADTSEPGQPRFYRALVVLP
jgi:hypothetical protein